MNAQGNPIQSRAAAKVACRPIDTGDLPEIVDLLTEGFPERDRAYWERGLDRLGSRPAIGNFPRFGYLLALDGIIVGCLLLIVSQDEQGNPRGNVSSWYVQPAYRSLASMLVSFVFRHKDLTLINISPAPHTIPILEAQGYKRYVDGQVIAAPLLSTAGLRARVIGIGPDANEPGLLPDHEMALLARHASWAACLSCVAASMAWSRSSSRKAGRCGVSYRPRSSSGAARSPPSRGFRRRSADTSSGMACRSPSSTPPGRSKA